MAKQKFTLSDEQFNKIIAINKKGGDPVMYLSGGIPMGRSLQEKINDYWNELGKEMGFDVDTISEPVDNRNFYAEPKPKGGKDESAATIDSLLEENVTITKAEYEQLLASDKLLSKLRAIGKANLDA